jgi:predicted branched-subunit amino acid permease
VSGDAPHRHWFLFGACAALWVCWQATTAIGVFGGGAVPESWSLDFAIVVTFVAILVPAVRDRPAIAAGAVAAVIAALGFRWEYGSGLLAGVLAGIAAGVALDRIAGRRDAGPSDVEVPST